MGSSAIAEESMKSGRVARVVSDQLAYVHSNEDRATFPFRPSNVHESRGRSFGEMHIATGSDVKFLMNDRESVTTVFPLGTDSPDPLGLIGIGDPSAMWRADKASESAAEDAPQLELSIDACTQGVREFDEQPLRDKARQFGKFVDTSRLKPGDLVLIRKNKPSEDDSRLTIAVQGRGGYAAQHAQWTHTAMYLGDDLHVVEATTDSYVSGNVRLTNLDTYCTGDFVMRFRRPTEVRDNDRWKLCIRAMTRLRLTYDLKSAVLLCFYVIVRGRTLDDYDLNKALGRRVFCSTLYSDAYTEVTGRAISKLAGACIPALLSGSKQFQDIEPAWVKIK